MIDKLTGTRVRYRKGTSRPISNFEIDLSGLTGTVEVTDGMVLVRLDEKLEVLEEWDNCVQYVIDWDEVPELLATVEVF